MTHMAAGSDAHILPTLERFRSKLLDISTSNKLISLRLTQQNTNQFLRLIDCNLQAVLDGLISSREFGISALPDPPNDTPLAIADWAQQQGINPCFSLSYINAGKSHQGLLRASLLASRMERVAELIRRQAKSSVDETGNNILHLAFGCLEWFDKKGKSFLAPLILLPVELGKGSEVSGERSFRLSASDDSPIANSAISERLQRDYGLQLPVLTIDNGTIDLEAYFTAVTKSVSGFETWLVHPYLTLALLNFNGLDLYEDLIPEKIQHSQLVRQLLAAEVGDQDPLAEAEIIAADVQVDQLEIAERVPILIARADASQFAAVADVMNGSSMVIEGPPGTGKSQTITNIIANALYAGKRVLFVAEKKVALDVVHSRLCDAGLKPYCLRLESDRAHKKQVYDELAQRLVLTRPPTPLREGPRAIFNEVRDGLNQFTDLLNTPHEPEAQSRYSLLWLELQLRRELEKADIEFHALAIELPGAAALGRAEQETNLQLIEQLASLLNGLDQDAMEQMFAGIKSLPSDGFAVDALLDQARRWESDLEQLSETLERLQPGDVRSPAGLRQAAIKCTAMAERLPEPLQPEAGALLPLLSSQPIAEAAQSLLSAIREEKEIAQVLLTHFERLPEPLPQVEAIESLVTDLKQWRFDQLSIPVEMQERTALQGTLRHATQQIERLDLMLKARQGAIPLAKWSTDQLDLIQPLLSQLCSLPDWILAQRQNPLWRSDPRHALTLISEQQQLQDLRRQLNLEQAAYEALDGHSLKTALAALQRCHQKGLTSLFEKHDGAENRKQQIETLLSLLSKLIGDLTSLLSGIDINDVDLAELQSLPSLIRDTLALGPEVLAQRGSALWDASIKEIQSAIEDERDLLTLEAKLSQDGLVVPEGCSAAELRQAAQELDSRSLFSRVSGYLDGRRLRAKGICRQVGARSSRCDDLRALAKVVELRQLYPRGWQRQRVGVELVSEDLLNIAQRLQDWKADVQSNDTNRSWLEWIRGASEPSLRQVLQRFDDGLLTDLQTVARDPLWNGDVGDLTLPALMPKLSRTESEQADLSAAEPAVRWARAAGVQDVDAVVTWLEQVVTYYDQADRFAIADWDQLLRSGLEPAQIKAVITAAQGIRQALDAAAIEGLDAVMLETAPDSLKQALVTVEEQLRPLLDELFSSTNLLSVQARLEPIGPLLVSLADAASRYQQLLQRWQNAGLRVDASPTSLAVAPWDVGLAARRRDAVRDCLASLQQQAGAEAASAAPELMEQVLSWISDLRSGELPQDWQEPCLQSGSSAFIEDRRKQGRAIADALFTEQSSAVGFCTSAGLDVSATRWAEGRSVEDVPESTLRPWLADLGAQNELLLTWIRQQQLLQRLSGDDVRALVRELLHSSAAQQHWSGIYQWNVARKRLQQLAEKIPALQQLRGDDQVARRERFHHLEDELRLLDQQHVISTIHRDATDLPNGNNQGKKSDFTELALIQNEVLKQKGHRPLRHLFHQAGEALRGLKPCWMMPPGTVASLLPREAVEQFDLVIIDEASQMPPERALGLISRAKQCVVVGDPKQLPPTSFFQLRSSAEDEDVESSVDGETVNEESILDLCTKTFHPVRRLKWHYRSRHGSLIAFSNRHFYNNELVVFPSCDRDFAIHRHLVTDSRYKAGLNPPEINRVCAVVLDQLRRHPERSLGVVAMNEDQAAAIADQLEKLAIHHQELRQRLDEWDSSEELFVKALEKVQGDERDTIVISTTYGPSEPGGAVSLSLGPIKDQGGHRRLNVLFTRARHAIELVTSIQSHQIRPRATSKEGIHVLQAYLSYVEARSLDSDGSLGRDPQSPFELVVCEALQRHGFAVECRVGVANYFIDLAVRHPERPETYLLAIECDGPTYHAARAARDRDIYRQAVLEGLGWRVARIWSTAWSENPELETQKLLDLLAQRIDETASQVVINSDIDAPATEQAIDSVDAVAIRTNELGPFGISPKSTEAVESRCNEAIDGTEQLKTEAIDSWLDPHRAETEERQEAGTASEIDDGSLAAEVEDLTESWDEITLEETTWDVSEYPDYPWIDELDRRVHLDYEERLVVISKIANSDRSVEEWIDELLYQQNDPQGIVSLLEDQPLEELLDELNGETDWPVGAASEKDKPVRTLAPIDQDREEQAQNDNPIERPKPTHRNKYQKISETSKPELLPDDWQGSFSDRSLVELALQFAEASTRSSDPQTQQLMAGLLTFHIRENSAEAKAYKDHLAMNTESRYQDSDCIASATLEETGHYKNDKYYARYCFDGKQPFRFSKKKNNTVRIACLSSRINLELIEVDATSGVINLAVDSKDVKHLAEQTDLIHVPQDFSKGLRYALAEQAQQWLEEPASLPDTIQHLISQEESEQVSRLVQQANVNPEQRTKLLSDYLFDAEGKSLVLQGPPGSGKTTCAADVIATLVVSGCNVGVCANSHLAIDNVLMKTSELAKARGWQMNIAKFQGRTTREEREVFAAHEIEVIENKTFNRLHDVYGGTAFAFSHSRFDGLLDLLVIDEASQVPMANVLAMARCTRNLLLVGDQQQLAQPVVAEHPGQSGLSCLSYATAGEEVIPETKGLFLNKSWRMPPDLCSLVSETFYQERLRPHAANTVNRIDWDGPASGLLFLPVDHTDCHVYSEAEAKTVEELVSRLLGASCVRSTKGTDKSSEISWDDIAIMAPFNAQVNLLQRTLGDEARVGTVDRFQGQEAPIAIYSITTSSLLSQRGLEFALNANRVNVAISRAQCLSIVVGSPVIEQLLQAQEHLSRERDLFRRLSTERLPLASHS